jgi:hypothetical protein
MPPEMLEERVDEPHRVTAQHMRNLTQRRSSMKMKLEMHPHEKARFSN